MFFQDIGHLFENQLVMKLQQEKTGHQKVVKYFNNTYCLKNQEDRCFIFSVANELPQQLASMISSRMPNSILRGIVDKCLKICLSNAFAMGMRLGVSDLIVLMPNRVIFVEMKTEKGRQSEKQKEFEQIVTNLGFEYYIIRSLDEFKDCIAKN